MQTALCLPESSKIMKLMAKAGIIGLTAKSILATGFTTKWKAMEFYSGQMAKNTKVNSWRTGDTAMEYSGGKMVDSIKVNGQMASSTAGVFL